MPIGAANQTSVTSRRFLAVERERGGVDAEAIAGRRRSVGEHVAEVATALAATDLDTGHEMAVVAMERDGVGHRRFRKAGPPTARFELGVGAEERGLTRRAPIDAVVMAIPILAGEGPLGARLAEHFELSRCQLAAPFVVGLLD